MSDIKECDRVNHTDACNKRHKEWVEQYVEKLSPEEKRELGIAIEAFLLNAWLVTIREKGVDSLPPTLQLSLKEQSQAQARVDFLFEVVRNFPENVARKKREGFERQQRRRYR